MQTTDVFAVTTARIIETLEKGNVPWWQNPIKEGYSGLPSNFVTKRHYSGINVILLSMNSSFESPYYATFNQIRQLKGKIKPSENGKSTEIVYWDLRIRHNQTREYIDQDTYLGLSKDKKQEYSIKPWGRFYHVYCVPEQTEGIELPKPKKPSKIEKNKRCQAIWDNYKDKPALQFKPGVACYIPSKDLIQMPEFDSFIDEESAWVTLYHESVHSTGSSKKLNRPGVTEKISFASKNYSQEELVAEIGASFLARLTGIQGKVFDNSVSYLNSWLKVLNDDKYFIIKASSEAQKAVNHILGEGK